MEHKSLDSIDRKIVRVLQQEGRITNRELAERVNLTDTPCLKRVRQLEQNGIIGGYEARVDPRSLGLLISSWVMLRLSSTTREVGNQFQAAIRKIPAVTECYMTAGQKDYLARVYATDFRDYEKLLRDQLGSLPGISMMESLFILSDVVPRRGVDAD